MNTNTIQLIAQVGLLAVGPLLAGHGITVTQNNLEELFGALAFVAGVIWKFSHFTAATAAAASTPQSLPVTKGNGMAPTVPLLLLMLLPIGFAGCSSTPVVGHVYSFTDFCFGLDVQTTSVPNNTPRVRIGLVRSVQFIEPVATNAPLSVPDVANNFGLANSASGAISLDVSESVASGHYQTGTGTNPISSQPIIPK